MADVRNQHQGRIPGDKAFVPFLLKGESKTIVNVSSVGALKTFPGTSVYLGIRDKQACAVTIYGVCGHRIFQARNRRIRYQSRGSCDGAGTGHVRRNARPCSGYTRFSSRCRELADARTKTMAGEERYISITWDMPELEARKEEIVKDDKLKMHLIF